MTKWQAARELEKIMDRWMNFEFWAYCQLELRGEWTQERMNEVMANHERAEKRLNEFKAETRTREREMRAAGASTEEICAYRDSVQDQHDKLVAAWRSLDGLLE